MKKILITGINGFLGSHLSKLLKSNFEVIGLEYSTDNLFRISDDNFKVYSSKNCSLENIFKENNFFAVFHVATVYRRKEDPIKHMLNTNIMLPVRLLELSNLNHVKIFVNTDSFFNNPNYSYSYLSDYTLSKKHTIDWIKLLSTSSKCKVVNMKIFHMYGENDSPGKFVPQILNKIINNYPKIDMTPGLQTRDFIYVNDVVEAFKCVIINFKNLKNYQDFEVGTGKSFSIKYLVNTIKEITKSKTEFNFGALPYRKGEIMTAKAENFELLMIGWSPNQNLYKSLQTYIKNQYENFDI
tara:strand:- start:1067 stop:1957 length:891 start_codon:yes stop_codon:yes gene_type:complete